MTPPPAKPGYFITGTDTGIGKTLIASAVIHGLALRGLRVAGMKPVASGTVWRDGAWHNDDVDALMAASNVAREPTLVNPYLLHEPTAPHLAALDEGVEIDLAHIETCFRQLVAKADMVIVEGVGGFVVPLNAQLSTADLARRLGLPVIMVVGMRLGCINHGLLTAQAIASQGLNLAGWVANLVDPQMRNLQATIDSLRQRIDAPLLGCLPHLERPDAVSAERFLKFP